MCYHWRCTLSRIFSTVWIQFTRYSKSFEFLLRTSLRFMFSSIFSNSWRTSWSFIWDMEFHVSSSTSLKSPTDEGLDNGPPPGGWWPPFRPFPPPPIPPMNLSTCNIINNVKSYSQAIGWIKHKKDSLNEKKLGWTVWTRWESRLFFESSKVSMTKLDG